MRLQELKNKTILLENISDITRALELISAIKLKRLKYLMVGSKPFTQKSLELLIKLINHQKFFQIFSQNIFLKPPQNNKILVLVLGSDKGFCGLYNKNILRYSENEIEKLKEGNEVELVTIGRRTTVFFKKKNYKINRDLPEVKKFEEKEKSYQLFKFVLESYKKGEYQKILFFYTRYFNSFFQQPTKIQILPLEEEKIKEIKEITDKEIGLNKLNYIFEPSFEKIFEEIAIQLIKREIYYTVLQSKASEEASRMIAMQRATENSKELMRSLTLMYNKLSQAKITTEVSEISSAKEALS